MCTRPQQDARLPAVQPSKYSRVHRVAARRASNRALGWGMSAPNTHTSSALESEIAQMIIERRPNLGRDFTAGEIRERLGILVQQLEIESRARRIERKSDD